VISLPTFTWLCLYVYFLSKNGKLKIQSIKEDDDIRYIWKRRKDESMHMICGGNNLVCSSAGFCSLIKSLFRYGLYDHIIVYSASPFKKTKSLSILGGPSSPLILSFSVKHPQGNNKENVLQIFSRTLVKINFSFFFVLLNFSFFAYHNLASEDTVIY
jgi:hypothetical protein